MLLQQPKGGGIYRDLLLTFNEKAVHTHCVGLITLIHECLNLVQEETELEIKRVILSPNSYVLTPSLEWPEWCRYFTSIHRPVVATALC
jgi:hypothetical protein